MRGNAAGLIVLALLCMALWAAPVLADSKSDPLPANGQAQPVKSEAELRKELEAEYRIALEERLAAEKASYEGSLRSLWLANSAVWGVLLLFVAMQALSARKRERELERLRNR